MSVKFWIRVVKCQTCGTDLDYLDSERTLRVIPANGVLQKNLIVEPGEIQCPTCGKKYYYKGENVEARPVYESAAAVS